MPNMPFSGKSEECWARAADIATAALFMCDAEDRAFLLKIAEGWRRLAEKEMNHPTAKQTPDCRCLASVDPRREVRS